MFKISDRIKIEWMLLILAALLPLLDYVLPRELRIADQMQTIFIFAILGLGVNVVTGHTGLLNLGAAGFMAFGAYAYAILSCDVYPFQFGFFPALLAAVAVSAVAGVLLGLPAFRLRGDYLAIVTLGFGEIAQSVLRNVDTITRGSQGINPLPAPVILGYQFTTEAYQPWYYLFLGILALVVLLLSNLEKSHVGRAWISVREDELASSCMGNNPSRIKLVSFCCGAALCGLAGALWAAYLGSSGEPGNYDFQISIIAVCIVIVGGMGNLAGILLGAFVMVGFNSIVLVKIAETLNRLGLSSSGNVLLSPGNWKFLIFGLALVLMMRFRPEGLIPAGKIDTTGLQDQKGSLNDAGA